jgi:Flp pilus assembly protein TadD
VRRDSKAARKLNAEGLRALAGTHPNLVEAKRLFEKAVQLDPDNVELLNNLGDVVGRLEDFKAAEGIFAKVLIMAPKRRVANGNMGYVEAKLGKIDRAEVHFCEYVRAFDSFDKGEARLKASFGDPDPQVQNAVNLTIANCRP